MTGLWQWYYKKGIKNAVAVYQSVILIVYDFFSIGLLLKTLFSPWKRDVVEPGTPSLQLMMQAMWFNLIARLMGFVVRSLMIIFGTICLILTMLLGGLTLLVALGLPLTGPALAVLGVLLITNQTPLLVLTGLILVVYALVLWLIVNKGFGADKWSDDAPAVPIAQAFQQASDLQPWLTKRARLVARDLKNIKDLKKSIIGLEEGMFILAKTGIYPQDFTAQPFPENVGLQQVLVEAAQAAMKEGRERISVGELFIAIAILDQSIHPLLVAHDLATEDVYHIVNWQRRWWQLLHPVSPLLSPGQIKSDGGIGKDWAAGYTLELDKYSHNLTNLVNYSSWDNQFLAHAGTIDEIERVLSRSGKNNVILIGETGVGRRTLVLGFARRVLMGKTLRPLAHKKIIELDVNALLGAAATPEDLENNIIKILNDAVRAGNVVLFIDDIKRIVNSSEGHLGSINAAAILMPYLESSSLQLIATITPADFHKSVERQPSLQTTFEKIEVKEPTPAETIRILQEISSAVEGKYKVIVSYQAIKRIVAQSARYLASRKFPEKGIELLDEVAVEVSSRGSDNLITPQVVDKVLSQKANVPVGEAEVGESQTLLNMENLLHQRVVNQTQAITAIANALRRSRAGVGSPKKPVGTFLFFGPTGVGKTETAKALAEIQFGSEKNMIRVDMSEFQEITSIRRLIGDETQATGGVLTDAIREKPFTCVLLDEIEKAHPKILDLFLQVLDEGRLTDALGQEVDFTNSIIIATSNAGANLIRQYIDQYGAQINMEALSKTLLDYIQNQGIFRPEFLNRFDSVIAYRPLNVEELLQVVDRQLVNINQRLADKQITLGLNDGAKRKLAQIGFDPAFGARALVRTMTNTVENIAAQAILSGKVQKGGIFEVTAEMIQ